jgi:hypothetical protein
MWNLELSEAISRPKGVTPALSISGKPEIKTITVRHWEPPEREVG